MRGLPWTLDGLPLCLLCMCGVRGRIRVLSLYVICPSSACTSISHTLGSPSEGQACTSMMFILGTLKQLLMGFDH